MTTPHLRVGYNLRSSLPTSGVEQEFAIQMQEKAEEVEEDRPIHDKADLKTELFEEAEAVIDQWTSLGEILEAYEPIIRKRWAKKSKVKRRELILGIYPDIATMHAPEFDLLRLRWARVDISKLERPDEYYLVPQINLEDLSQGMFLPLFLNSRGRNVPHQFAHTDHYAMRFGVNMLEVLEPIALDGSEPWKCAVIFTNLDSDYYLEFVESEPRLSEVLASGRGFTPARASLIISAQTVIYDFLLGCCVEILHDIPSLLDTNHDFHIVPEPEPIIATSSQRLDPLFAATEAPYRPPGQMDFQRIEELLEAACTAAQDHVWTLREDPSYIAEIFEGRAAHKEYYKHPKCTKTFQLMLFVECAYRSLLLWSSLREDFRTLKKLKQEYFLIITPEKQLPKEYEWAFLCFWDNLGRASDVLRRMELKQAVYFGPTFQNNYTGTEKEGNGICLIVDTSIIDITFGILSEICQNRLLAYSSLPDILDEFERALVLAPAERNRLSIFESFLLSDIGILALITRELNLYQPWASTVDLLLNKHGETIKAITDSKWERVKQISDYLPRMPSGELRKLIIEPNCFDYPAQKRRSFANTQIMRKAEKRLDDVWDLINRYYLEVSGKATLVDAHQDLFPDQKELLRTPEWTEPLPKVRQPRIQRALIDDELVNAFEHVQVEEGKTIQSSNTILPKGKSKSRKEQLPQDAAALSEEVPEVVEVEAPPAVIRVNRKVYRVFTALFYTPSENDPPGEISWQDFLQAMAAGGLNAEPLYGSIWHFTPQINNPSNLKRSIQFHQPHPGKIRFRTARFFGRRLKRAFGWDMDLFVLE
ncbi:hypothetical protein MFRU_003g02330 [Monilinia fructicola]|uniref:Uncharacterized protein n=1 Tax=Monilinia fructicola TaxID=38448 RepID=A0A5M9JSU6_MONFR|nr:hypothetical protein EYC84_003180 [Monilinia fructicola]KAG4034260.1 hypothetical protein MFRU_003g02330 [Monilinia fructicola]